MEYRSSLAGTFVKVLGTETHMGTGKTEEIYDKCTTAEESELRAPLEERPKMLITPEYVALNQQLHAERQDYGALGAKHLESVRNIAKVHGCRSLLDYGCGKQSLIEALKLPWARGYDPCIPGLDLEPQPADLVVCTDTLEHIEPDCLEAVLDHIKSLCLKVLYVSISLIPAKKTLPDGRNTHLIVQPASWWMWRLLARWELDTARASNTELNGVFRATGQMAQPMKILNNIRE